VKDGAVIAYDPQSMQVIGYFDSLRLLLVSRTTDQRKTDNAHQTNLVRQAGPLALSKILQFISRYYKLRRIILLLRFR
jgi:hypothetical protein